MSDDDPRFDRIERKINRIGSVVVTMAAVVSLVALFVILRWLEIPITPMQVGLIVAIAIGLGLIYRRPFRD